jgi:hypothetical protein
LYIGGLSRNRTGKIALISIKKVANPRTNDLGSPMVPLHKACRFAAAGA